MKIYPLGPIVLGLIALMVASCSPTAAPLQRAQRLTMPPDAPPYVQQYAHIAVAEMERTGIPASIKLAQGILESNYGKSSLAVEANNHFGIKCGGEWRGETFHKKDDDPGLSCFRKYSRSEQSYYDHSTFLCDPKKKNRYGFLFELKKTDYRGWATGLQKAGYATSQTYASKLIDLIERLGLDRFDRMSLPDAPSAEPGPKEPAPGVPSKIPDGPLQIQSLGDAARFVEVPMGKRTLQEIAEELHLRPSRLAQYNETDERRVLRAGERIWLTPKRNRFGGHEKTHAATAAQTLYEVSQFYGIRLAPLAKRNGLPADAVLKAGQQIVLK
jgi:hypothetical protein